MQLLVDIDRSPDLLKHDAFLADEKKKFGGSRELRGDSPQLPGLSRAADLYSDDSIFFFTIGIGRGDTRRPCCLSRCACSCGRITAAQPPRRWRTPPCWASPTTSSPAAHPPQPLH